MEDKRIPSLLLNILLTQVEEMMGRRSLIVLLRQAGLANFIDHLPPKDETPSITLDQYSQLLAHIYDIFGAQGARPIFLRGGRLGSAELRRQRPAQFALNGIALRLLPTNRRMQFVLERLVEQSTDMYGASYHLEERENAFFLEMTQCPFCTEISRRRGAENRPVTKPVCHIPAAVIAELIEWATSNKHLVQEIACIATGDPACRFRVSK